MGVSRRPSTVLEASEALRDTTLGFGASPRVLQIPGSLPAQRESPELCQPEPCSVIEQEPDSRICSDRVCGSGLHGPGALGRVPFLLGRCEDEKGRWPWGSLNTGKRIPRDAWSSTRVFGGF